MTIGDVKSDARGSGARYNDGKIHLEYVPIHLWEHYDIVPEGWLPFVRDLAKFQQGDVAGLYDALFKTYHYLHMACEVFHYGAQKYAAWNWAKGMNWSVPLACIGRHLRAMHNGEVYDSESGLDHKGHIVCNLIMLAHFVDHYPEGDDRPHPNCFKQPENMKDDENTDPRPEYNGPFDYPNYSLNPGCCIAAPASNPIDPWSRGSSGGKPL